VIAAEPDDKLPDDDILLLKEYQLPDYEVKATPFACDTNRKSHKIFRYVFSPRRSDITLLQQAVSHVLWLRQRPKEDVWPIRLCGKTTRGGLPCGRYYFAFYSRQQVCDRCSARASTGEFDGEPEFEQVLAQYRALEAKKPTAQEEALQMARLLGPVLKSSVMVFYTPRKGEHS